MPLPLREYYPIERAAELLECTADDFICWAGAGSIRLLIYLDEVPGLFRVWDWRDYYKEITKGFDFPEITNDLSLRESFHMSICNILDVFKKEDEISVEDRRLPTMQYYATLHQIFCGYFRERYCNIEDQKEEKMNESINSMIDLFLSTGRPTISISVVLNGLFVLGEDFYFKKEISTTLNNEMCLYSPDYYSLVYPNVDKDIKFNISDLFILKDDFLRIKKASEKGEAIPLLEDENEMIESRKENKNGVSANRISSPYKIALKSLISNYLPEVKYNPSILAGILSEEAKKAGFGNVNFSKDTVSRWIK